VGVVKQLGAQIERDGVRFTVWAPNASRVEVVIGDERFECVRDGEHHVVHVPNIGDGARYRFSLDGGSPMPDPASRAQPDGVHGASQVVDPSRFDWSAWQTPSLANAVIYELHVGTFSPEGTFDGARARLEAIVETGATFVELMPVHDFPGARNWGYDPAAFGAPARAYGTPDDLRRMIDAAHRAGLGVIVDVVYNHLGPDGAYWAAYGPVLDRARGSAWGPRVDFSVRAVRDFVIQNAVRWIREYRADGLRLDATHAIIDDSEEHILTELAREVHAAGGFVIAEDERNLASLVRPEEVGLDGVWADDLHHLVRRLLAGDSHGYYRPYPRSTAAIARCIEQNWHRNAEDARDLDPSRFVICIQNHDQIGNRPTGDRLHHGVSLAAYRAASALLYFAPQTVLLFMGQEYAAATPFLFFTDHERELGQRVSEGRRREFADFPGFAGAVPDPQARSTFDASRLDWTEREREPHAGVLRLYRALAALRRTLPLERSARSPEEGIVVIERGRFVLAARLSGDAPLPEIDGRMILDTEDRQFTTSPDPAGPRAIVVERA
jgi:maltooligosyltrehalose trehalohydrolase